MAILNITKENYQAFIQSETPVLVEFSATWCVYCKRLAPALEELARQYADRLQFGAVDIDHDPELAEAEQIQLVPTLLLYQKGQLLGSVVAPKSKAELEAFLAETLSARAADKVSDSRVRDMIVVGGGPGGYTAALYAARAGLDTIVLEKLSAGGQMAQAQEIENYPGFDEAINGFLLAEKMRKGAEHFGVETRLTEVVDMALTGAIKQVHTSEGTYYGKTVVLATGASPRKLGIPGEQELIGRGVNYCAACDGAFYRDKTVVITGGGNSAAADALLLSRICKKVILVHRRDTLRATKVYHNTLMETENLEFIWDSQIVGLHAEDKLQGVQVRSLKTGEEQHIPCDGIFVSIGRAPATELLQGQITLDASGYIAADETTRTNLPGVFAVGDVRAKPVRQVVTAVADGAVAVHYAEEYLAETH